MKLALATLAWLWITSSIASAQAGERDAPPNAKRELLRISLGAGLSIVSGPDAQVDGVRVEDEAPGSVPMPNAVARVELVLSELLLVGVQASAFMWEVPSQQYFGGGPQGTIDLSALLRLRLSVGSYRRHEFVASIPFGPSFDLSEVGPRNFGGELSHELAWHAGLFGGYQYSPVRNPIGFFVEAGLIYHRVPLSIEYESTTEEITYEPIEAMIRGGMMIPIR